MPPGLGDVKPGDTIVFWPTTPEWTKEYPDRWKIGGELTFESKNDSAPRPCKATWKDGGGTAWLYWCDVALPGTRGDASTWKTDQVTVCSMDGETVGTYEMVRTVGEICEKIAKDLDVSPNFIVELSHQEKKLSPKSTLQAQGVKDGDQLTMVKTEGKSVVGKHNVGSKTYEEDRYSESWDIELKEDSSCTYFTTSMGTGRTGRESTTHTKADKSGTWAIASRTYDKVTVVIEWDGGKRETHTFRI